MPKRTASRIPFRVKPMLATLVAEPFQLPGWVFEEKYDGDRILAYKEGRRVRLLSRNGKDRTRNFPLIVDAILRLPARSLLLDGEVVVFDRRKVSHFQALQQGSGQPAFAAFDCLFHNGRDLRREPLSERYKILRGTMRRGPRLVLARRLNANGIAAFRQAKKRGLEGLVAKDLTAPYVQARSRCWLKVKVHNEDEFIILGYTPPAGKRKYFGALLLGAHDKGKLRYVGKVGTGFDAKRLKSLFQKFQSLKTGAPAFEPPKGRDLTFLKPRLVAQISYQELTADKKLRQPVFLGLRTDKAAREVTLPR